MDESPSFEILIARREGSLVLAPRGEIDMATAPSVLREVQAHDGVPQRVVLDLGGVSFMDTSGLEMMIQVQRHAEGTGGRFVVVQGPPIVQRILDIAGFSGRMRFVSSVDAALGDGDDLD